jgi:uncharacterized protein YutD
MFVVANKGYELRLEHRSGWNFEMFRDRYSDVLARYDYISGDWGYNQLRLRGFFKADHPQATKETSIVYFEDYLHEYCNFGCAYFLVEKVAVTEDAIVQNETSEEQIPLEN